MERPKSLNAFTEEYGFLFDTDAEILSAWERTLNNFRKFVVSQTAKKPIDVETKVTGLLESKDVE